MSPSDRQIIEWDLRLCPYFAAVGAFFTIVPAFWVHFYPSFLALSVGLGVFVFFLKWLRLHRGWADLGFVGMIVTIFAFLIGRDHLLPPNSSYICEGQFIGVFMFSLAGLQLLFRRKLKRDLETNAA